MPRSKEVRKGLDNVEQRKDEKRLFLGRSAKHATSGDA